MQSLRLTKPHRMGFFSFLIFSLFLQVIKEVSTTSDKKIFCLYSNKSPDILQVEDINEQYCTHLIYTYMGVANDGQIKSFEPYLDFKENDGLDNLRRFNHKKHFNVNLKTLVAVGGWEDTEKSSRYSKLFRNKENQQKFAKKSFDFLIKYKFDGLALHWIYPALFGGDPNIDRFTFTSLLQHLKQEFIKKNLILVVICHGINSQLDESYNVEEITEIVDFIYVAAYDFYGTWNLHIGIGSALYLHPNENSKDLSADSFIKSWINRGAQTEKIIMGVPFFGRSFTLKYQNQTEPGSLFIKSELPEITSYMEMCRRFIEEEDSWTMKWENTQKNPYAFKNNGEWVGYENEKSLEIKVKYVIEHNLGGIGSFIDDDDIKGICGEKNILLKTLYDHMRIIEKFDTDYKYVFNFNVFKVNINDQSVQCIYQKSGKINNLF